MFERARSIIRYGGVGKADYYRVRPAAQESNRKNLQRFALLVTIAMALLAIVSFFADSMEKNRAIYTACAIASAAVAVAACKKDANFAVTTSAMYLFIGMLYVFGIVLGTIIEPNEVSASFPVLLFAAPLLFTDVPLRMSSASIIAIVAYCVMAAFTQHEPMIEYNLSNVIPFGIASILLTSYLMTGKFGQLLLEARIQDASKALEDQIDRITDLNKELEITKEAAEAASAAKTSFLFNMSHDIRTPMNAIMGFTGLAKKHRDEPERINDYLDKIQTSSETLLSIINNVLEMARIEKGAVDLNEEPWTLGDIARSIKDIYGPLMEEKGLEFSVGVPADDITIACDNVKVREIIDNLVSNAFKYTNPGGSVNLTVESLPHEQDGWVYARTTISDTGMGMSEDFLPILFEEFSREANSTESSIQGTGLGMPIVKRLVDLMDGTIEARSEKGVGTTISFTMPHRLVEKAKDENDDEAAFDLAPLNGKRILLAEDNILNAEIAREILTESGFVIEHAENGAVCVDLLSNAPAGTYDVVLMDIQMPQMDGYEATQTIRALDDPDKAQIPILAMTANAFDEDRRKALSCGMNGHIAKPINVEELTKALMKALL